MTRRATIERATSETEIALTLALDGEGATSVATGVPFFDHMLEAFGRHGLFDLEVEAEGDLAVDAHHTVEAVFKAFGRAMSDAVRIDPRIKGVPSTKGVMG